MPKWKKGERPDIGKAQRTEASNSLRMFKVLTVLRRYSDSNNRLTQQQIMELLSKDEDTKYSCNSKTLAQTLRGLISEINPKELTADNRDEFIIRYNGWEKGIPERLTRIYYNPRIEAAEIQGMIDGIKLTDTLSIEQKKKLYKKLKSEYPRININNAAGVSLFSVDDTEAAIKNTELIMEAIYAGRQITYHFGGYDMNGEIIPRKSDSGKARLYTAAPYYVAIYGGRRYMLCSHISHDGQYSEEVSIYRVDLMSGIHITDKPCRLINDMREFQNTNSHEFMLKHPNMTYGDPITVTLMVDADYYTLIHDHFGGGFEFVRHIDEKHDEIRVTSSEKGIIDLAMTAPDRIEIIRPFTLRDKAASLAQELVKRYG
ncbi:MAG: WYL domain-containing protein [Oscillospiraceae bacterium]